MSIQEILEKKEEIVAKLEKVGLPRFDFEVSVVRIKSARTAGLAYGFRKVELNELYLRDHKEELINRTLGHEICHLYQSKYYPRAKQAHGPEWRRLMRIVGIDESRCHSMYVPEIAQARKKKTRFIYTDGEKMYNLTKKQHTLTVNSGQGYAKLRNGTKIVYTGKTKVFY